MVLKVQLASQVEPVKFSWLLRIVAVSCWSVDWSDGENIGGERRRSCDRDV